MEHTTNQNDHGTNYNFQHKSLSTDYYPFYYRLERQQDFYSNQCRPYSQQPNSSITKAVNQPPPQSETLSARFSTTESMSIRSNGCHNFPFSPELVPNWSTPTDHNSSPYKELMEPDAVNYFLFHSPYSVVLYGNTVAIYEQFRLPTINKQSEMVILDEYRTNQCLLPLMSLIYFIEMTERYRHFVSASSKPNVESPQESSTSINDVTLSNHNKFCKQIQSMIDNIELSLRRFEFHKLTNSIRSQTGATIRRLKLVQDPILENLSSKKQFDKVNFDEILSSLSNYIETIRNCSAPLLAQYGKKSSKNSKESNEWNAVPDSFDTKSSKHPLDFLENLSDEDDEEDEEDFSKLFQVSRNL